MAGAYETKQYRNVFAEAGYDKETIEKRKNEIFHIRKKKSKKEYRRHLRRFFMAAKRSAFTMKPGRIWDLWKIPAIMMRGPRACRMA